MKKIRTTFGILLGFTLLTLISGCTKYIPYEKSEFRETVEKNAISVIQLPYRSGKDITIDPIGENKLIISEPGMNYKLSLIDANNVNPSIKNAQIKYGKFYRIKDNNEILVIGKSNEDYYVYLLDLETLQQIYSKMVDFTRKGKTAISGIELTSNKIVFYQSDIYVDYVFIGNTGYPHISEILYTFKILNTKNGGLINYDDIRLSQIYLLDRLLEKLNYPSVFDSMIDKSTLEIAESLKGLSEKKDITEFKIISDMIPIEKMLFYINKVFLVNNNKTVVFSLSNDDNNLLHCSFDVQKGISSLMENTAQELANRYDELIAVEKKPKEGAEEKPKIEISGVKYEYDDLKLVNDLLIVAARDDLHTKIICADYNMQKKWESDVEIPYYLDQLIVDRNRGLFYIPDARNNKNFVLKAYKTEDGKPVEEYLPANFLIDNKTIKVTGTTFDFQDDKLYIYNNRKHQIICLKLSNFFILSPKLATNVREF